MFFRPLVALSFVVLGAILVPGCGAQDGQVCQIDGDCASGLMCTCKLGTGSGQRGICHAVEPTNCATGMTDAGPDAGTDANVLPGDAGPDADTGPTEDVGTDAGSDAGNDADTDAATVDVGVDGGNDAA